MVESPGGNAQIGIRKEAYVYTAQLSESNPTSVTSGTFKVELFRDITGTYSPTLVNILYIKQATPNNANIEYVTCRWNLGYSEPDANTVFTIMVTQVA